MADVPDPGTGLTPREKDAIRESWTPVSADMKTHGVALFIKLFKAYPAYKDLFPDFRGRDLDELQTSYHIRAHGTTVMFNLGSMINSLDDAECLARMIRKLGTNHYHQKVSMDQFHKLGPLIIELFQEALGAGFTDEMKAAWLKLYTVLCSLVEDGMKQAKAS